MKNKQGKADRLIVFVIIAIAVVAVFYVFGGEGLLPEKEGDIVNGYWDEATQECRSAPNRPTGIPYIPGQVGVTLGQCCFNRQHQQVDCNNPSILWGAGSFAIYQGQAGLFFVNHYITLTNIGGNVDITKAWINSATWSPTNAALSNAYATVVGSAYGSPLLQGQAVDFSTGQIDLQAIGGPPGSPKTYALSLETKASATGLPDYSRTTPASITVEQEAIGFSVDINLGA